MSSLVPPHRNHSGNTGYYFKPYWIKGHRTSEFQCVFICVSHAMGLSLVFPRKQSPSKAWVPPLCQGVKSGKREGKGRKATGDGKSQIKEPATQARSAADCFGVLAEAYELLHLRASPWEDKGRRHIFHLLMLSEALPSGTNPRTTGWCCQWVQSRFPVSQATAWVGGKLCWVWTRGEALLGGDSEPRRSWYWRPGQQALWLQASEKTKIMKKPDNPWDKLLGYPSIYFSSLFLF